LHPKTGKKPIIHDFHGELIETFSKAFRSLPVLHLGEAFLNGVLISINFI
jgi:hypothetical protein